jgi:hypothetical protein
MLLDDGDNDYFTLPDDDDDDMIMTVFYAA